MGSASSISVGEACRSPYILTTLCVPDRKGVPVTYTNCVEETLAWLVNHCPRSTPAQKELCNNRLLWALYLYTLPGFKYKKDGVELMACLQNVWNFFRQFYGWSITNPNDLTSHFSTGKEWKFTLTVQNTVRERCDRLSITVWGVPHPFCIVITQRFADGERVSGHSEVMPSFVPDEPDAEWIEIRPTKSSVEPVRRDHTPAVLKQESIDDPEEDPRVAMFFNVGDMM